MSDLLSFLLANPLLLIVVIGLLISTFSRMAQSKQPESDSEGPAEQRQPQQQRSNPQHRNRPVEAKPQQKTADEIKWEDYFPTEAAPPNQTQSTAQNKQSSANGDQRQQELYERQKQARAKAREIKEQVDLSAISDLTVERDRSIDGLDMDFKNLSGKKAMQAVVWSEVLGPPKGRSAIGKYRSNRR
ncbi:hypothetical protein JCM19045_4720 [Bacillus sp. JCM 19045]|uniref:DNA mismatch repair ATPase MutL n=1 Tax=Shouchella xiaoxiensis TaxID=766895 RepID=A0ABS2SRH6_9BACI|nr:hypothetical protein [Shouchella xiaoxiensis]MBM7838093.1 DNA mismatch repair ATPase MutL [Shouchella xiaoxiensis]GAF15357.1 hypothetical protein JCM19045_4720 [Bacillus sp. JCM 19045]